MPLLNRLFPFAEEPAPIGLRTNQESSQLQANESDAGMFLINKYSRVFLPNRCKAAFLVGYTDTTAGRPILI